MGLFLHQGFDATTIDQIIEQVGVSRRTFFCYFGTKEDIVLGDLVARGAAIAHALAARPTGDAPWDPLRAALAQAERTLFTDGGSDGASMLAFGRMLFDTPTLLARHLGKRLRWLEMLVPLVAARLSDDDRELPAPAIVASALACLDAASRAWVRSDGLRDFGELYDQAVSAVRR